MKAGERLYVVVAEVARDKNIEILVDILENEIFFNLCFLFIWTCSCNAFSRIYK